MKTTITPERYAVVRNYLGHKIGDFFEAVVASDIVCHDDDGYLYGLEMIEDARMKCPGVFTEADSPAIYAKTCEIVREKIDRFGYYAFVGVCKPTRADREWVETQKDWFEAHQVFWFKHRRGPLVKMT